MVSKKVSISDEELELQLRGYLSQGLTYLQIAEKYDTTKGTISKWCSKLGLNHTKLQSIAKVSKPLETKETKPKSTSSKTPSEPQTPHSSLNPYVREILAIQSAFESAKLQCNTQAAMALKDRADQLSNTGDLPPWSRPPCLNKKQNDIIDAIVDPNIQVVFVDGDKRTGKSTSWFLGVCECVWDGTIKRWGFWSKSQENAIKILRDVRNDPISVAYSQKLYKGMGSALRLLFFNNGYIEVGATDNENSASGQAYQGIVIDETHVVVVENPNTFAMIAMILRSEPHMKLVFCANQGKTAFQMLKEKLLTAIDPKRIRFFTLTKEDTTHITEENDKLVRTLVEASAGEEMAAQFLDNAVIREGELMYKIEHVQKAFQPYECPNLEQFEVIGAGVDWGDTHDLAIHVAGFLDNNGYELEMIYMQHPDNTMIVATFVRLIREYPGLIIIWEESPLGAFTRNELRKLFPNQVFMGSNFTQHKQNYIDNLYCWLSDGEIHLKDGKLKRQLVMYKNDKKNDDGHDALAHLYYKAQKPRTALKTEIEFVSK